MNKSVKRRSYDTKRTKRAMQTHNRHKNGRLYTRTTTYSRQLRYTRNKGGKKDLLPSRTIKSNKVSKLNRQIQDEIDYLYSLKAVESVCNEVMFTMKELDRKHFIGCLSSSNDLQNQRNDKNTIEISE